MCLNFVQLLSFGKGNLVVQNSAGQGQPFAIPTADSTVHVFHPDHLVQYLTFDWFKAHVICAEKPLICRQFPLSVN